MESVKKTKLKKSRRKNTAPTSKMKEIRLRPSEIRYSQSSISNTMQDGTNIGELLDDIYFGRCFASAVPMINVARVKDAWVAADNRRLWVLKQLESLGKVDVVTVKVVNRVYSGKMTSENGGMSVEIRNGPPGGVVYPVMCGKLAEPKKRKKRNRRRKKNRTDVQATADTLPLRESTNDDDDSDSCVNFVKCNTINNAYDIRTLEELKYEDNTWETLLRTLECLGDGEDSDEEELTVSNVYGDVFVDDNNQTEISGTNCNLQSLLYSQYSRYSDKQYQRSKSEAASIPKSKTSASSRITSVRSDQCGNKPPAYSGMEWGQDYFEWDFLYDYWESDDDLLYTSYSGSEMNQHRGQHIYCDQCSRIRIYGGTAEIEPYHEPWIRHTCHVKGDSSTSKRNPTSVRDTYVSSVTSGRNTSIKNGVSLGRQNDDSIHFGSPKRYTTDYWGTYPTSVTSSRTSVSRVTTSGFTRDKYQSIRDCNSTDRTYISGGSLGVPSSTVTETRRNTVFANSDCSCTSGVFSRQPERSQGPDVVDILVSGAKAVVSFFSKIFS